jgi:hypothetical protein
VIQKIIEKNTSLTTQYVLARTTIRARDDEILTLRHELPNADRNFRINNMEVIIRDGPEPRRISKQNLVVYFLVLTVRMK